MPKLKGCMQIKERMGDLEKNAGQNVENLGVRKTFTDVMQTYKEMIDHGNPRIQIKENSMVIPQGLSTD